MIGISGLESTYEDYLRGTKGSREITVDGGTSRIISEKTTKDPVAGNDLYLTIDAKLQEECYHLLEERIAGILIANINNSMTPEQEGIPRRTSRYRSTMCTMRSSRITLSMWSVLRMRMLPRWRRQP
jgi:cell division protein FtsI/penicillin-binding protein 2